MATWFEVWLVGGDADHLTAVGEAALDEVVRIEQLLSRFDPASEVARVNREALHGPVLLDRELFAILTDCRRWSEETDGYFDIALSSSHPFAEAVQLDEQERTVSFLRPAVLDLGGYGKGYALERAGRILRTFGVTSALMHGGTSSVLACGLGEDGQPWRVGVRNPFGDSTDEEVVQLALTDCGLSSSAVLTPQGTESDIIDPVRGQALTEPAGCTVVAPSALDAEVLSTALLAMGRCRGRAFVCDRLSPDYRVAWMDEAGGVSLEWLTGGRVQHA
jgi:thiamine biosynthesis lipoprotein